MQILTWKEWDLNPRYKENLYKDLADLHFKPLSHQSILKKQKNITLLNYKLNNSIKLQ